MKTEKQIAKEYIDELEDMQGSSQILISHQKIQMKEHKQSCERFLEFLSLRIENMDLGRNQDILVKKREDLKEAIKIYEKVSENRGRGK